MKSVDEQYQELVSRVYRFGELIETRGHRCFRVFQDVTMTFWSFPLVSLRKTAWKNAIREWEWFMSGSCDINDLHESVRHWWKPWADDMGHVLYNYSQQFRHFTGVDSEVDQIKYFIEGIKNHPYSRRNVITTWNTADMLEPDNPITNCHGTVIQAFVDRSNRLHIKTYQRSVDVICGLPHNWVQYWAFLVWLCPLTGTRPGSLIWIGGDVHIYEEHSELVGDMLSRDVSGIDTPGLFMSADNQFRARNFAINREYRPLIETKAKMVV